MENNLTEIFDKNSKIIIGAMILFVFSLVLILYKLGYFEDRTRDSILNENFRTIVASKYINKSNHNNPELELSNGNKMTDYWPGKNINILVGDSLIKESNSSNLIVKRNSKIIYSINLLD